MRLLVTGGAGYIGSVVAAALLDAGHEVVVLDDLSTGHADAVPAGARFVQASIVDAGLTLAAEAFDGVLHFAAKSLVGESVQRPELYWQNNVAGTLALLEAMRANNVGTLVFSSSAATYGEPTEVPIEETAAPAPTNPYGASKLAVDLMLSAYARAYGLAAVSLRYFNVAGARLPDLGERHAVETHLVPNALRAAAGDGELNIFGTDYPTPDGTCVRDYLHVLDLADAHLRALTAARPNEHLVINLGSGSGYSVREVVNAVRAVTGAEPPVHEGPRRAGDPAVLIASSTLAKDLLGWSPTLDLNQMVADAWAFYRTH